MEVTLAAPKGALFDAGQKTGPKLLMQIKDKMTRIRAFTDQSKTACGISESCGSDEGTKNDELFQADRAWLDHAVRDDRCQLCT
jgi:hypothetical protein